MAGAARGRCGRLLSSVRCRATVGGLGVLSGDVCSVSCVRSSVFGRGTRRGGPGADRPAVRRDLGRRSQKPLPAATSTGPAPGGGAALPPPCSAAQSRRRRETKAAPDRAEHLRAPGSRFVSPGTLLPAWPDCSGYPDSRTAMTWGVTRDTLQSAGTPPPLSPGHADVSRDTPHTRDPAPGPQAGTLAPKPGPGPPVPGPGPAPGPVGPPRAPHGPPDCGSGHRAPASVRVSPSQVRSGPAPLSPGSGQPLSAPVRASRSQPRFGPAPLRAGSGQPLAGQDAQAPAHGQPRSGSG